MREDLLEQLETWHEEDEFEQIVDAIADIPEEERDYELVSHLGRAMNNLERYEEAVEQFLTVAEEGQDDSLWHYRIGLAYYYLDRYEEALQAFEAADKLDPGDEDTLEFLDSIRQKLAESEPVEELAGGARSGGVQGGASRCRRSRNRCGSRSGRFLGRRRGRRGTLHIRSACGRFDRFRGGIAGIQAACLLR